MNHQARVAQLARAQPCQGWGRGFESRLSLFFLPKMATNSRKSGDGKKTVFEFNILKY